MLIEKIILKNFRVYKGTNELQFAPNLDRNVSVVAGNNGYGKTSLLTSLVWCLYGKLMVDVDDRYRTEVQDSGGYKRYCDKMMNREALEGYHEKYEQLTAKLQNVNAIDKRLITEQIKELQSFSVTVQFSKLYIPSLPCDEVIVQRTYNVVTHAESVQILIDGRKNELTATVGESIFINDFILPKEIAKFFFFDAERIVSLAEISTAEEKKILSQAYAEVLGIKKYVDLKENLQNLRLRLRRKSSSKEDRDKLDKLKKQLEEKEAMLIYLEGKSATKREELAVKKAAADKLQEQLIRQGSSLSLEDVKDFQRMRESLEMEGKQLKARLTEMMDLVPFAIAANKFKAVKEQLEAEQAQNHSDSTDALLDAKAAQIEAAIKKHKKALGLDNAKEAQLLKLVKENLLLGQPKDFKLLLDFTNDQYNRFIAIYNNLENAFNKGFRQLVSDQKKQQSSLLIIQRKLTDAETKENDAVIKKIRQDKNEEEAAIAKLESSIIALEAQKILAVNEKASIAKVLAEMTKNIQVEDSDAGKDQVAERLIGELSAFIRELKNRKKASLERNIQVELNRLMHKKSFVSRVEVIIEGELIDIELYDTQNALINKDGLSKGEQQLYATALLKALIEESNIQFPVFIDSPLQKFDREHSRNIITEFYPAISGQVILFPLLEKELNEDEYEWLLPQVATAYLIDNQGQYQSGFIEVEPKALFPTYRNRRAHVYQH